MGLSAYGMVRVADGSEKRAEDVVAGDVLSDPVSGGAATVGKVWSGPGVGMTRLETETGALLDLTGDQLVATEQGMLPAGRVTPGMAIRTASGLERCREASPLAGDYMVYDLVCAGGPAVCLCVNSVIVGGVGK